MTFKRSLSLSLLFGFAGGLGAYLLAWGFFSTHPELGAGSEEVRAIAFWAAPLVFLVSLVYFTIRGRAR